MKHILIIICFTFTCFQALAQDTVKVTRKHVALLSVKNKLYYFMPEDSLQTDSVIVVNGKVYFKLMQDKESCKTFIDLYYIYQKRVAKGDADVQGLIDSYEGIIKTKDSSYAVLFHQYYKLNSLLTSSINETERSVNISKNALDTLSSSLHVISDQNNALNKDLKIMKAQNNKNKLKFGLGGLILGLVIGLLLVH